jgi:3',5'-cyclic-AMP phosphodiesterase
MNASRREFISLGFKSVFIIGLGNTLESFTADHFNFPQKNEISLRFAIASDGHYGQPQTEYEIYHDEIIGWINTEKEQRGLDFAFINGDMFHNDVAFLEEVKKKWDGLKMPYYVSHGNHDNTDPENWQRVWNMKEDFVFENNDIGFLVLNTADEKGKYICPDLDFAKVQLQKMLPRKHLFVFMHITPVKWTPNGIDCSDLVDLFSNQPNLRAIFHGHDHQLDDVKLKNGKYYFFDSHIGGNWGTNYRGYRIVEVHDSGDIFTYQMNPIANTKVNTNDLSKSNSKATG